MYFDPPDLTLYDPNNFNRQAFVKEKETLTVAQANNTYGKLTGVNLWQSIQYFLTGFSVNDFTINSSGEISSSQPATFSVVNASNSLFVKNINIIEQLNNKRDLDNNEFSTIILNGFDVQENLDMKRDYDDLNFTSINLNGNDLQELLDTKRDYNDNEFETLNLNGVNVEESLNSKRNLNDVEFNEITLNGYDLKTLLDTKRNVTDTNFQSLSLNEKPVATEEFVETRVSELIGGVPTEQLDTIYELGSYLQNQDNELSALVQLINTKASVEYVDTKLTVDEIAQYLQTEDITFNGKVGFGTSTSYVNDVSFNDLDLVHKKYVDETANIVLQVSKDYADTTKLTTDDLTEYIENADIMMDGSITFSKPASYYFSSNYDFDASLNNLNLVPKQYLKSELGKLLLQSQLYADTKITEEELVDFLENKNITFPSNNKINFSTITSYVLDPSFNFDASLNAFDLVPQQYVKNYVKSQFDNLPLEFDVGLVEVGATADAFIEQDIDNINKWLLNLQLPRAQGFSYKFEWTNNTTYFAYDVVRYEKDTFVCIVPTTTNFNNPMDSEEWDYFTIGGVDGSNGQDATGGDSMLSAMTTAIIGILAQSALNFVAQGIIRGFQDAMMNMLGDKINDQIDDAVGDAMDQIDEENIKRRIKHIDAEPVSFIPTDGFQPYTSISSQLKIVNELNTANITLDPEGSIECKNISNSEVIETNTIYVNNDLNVTDNAILLGDTYVSQLKPLTTDITETISINGNIIIEPTKSLQANNITAVGNRDELIIKAPYLTFDIEPIEYNEIPDNPFESLYPTEPQVISFRQLPRATINALDPVEDLDFTTVKYVKQQVNELQTDMQTKLDTTNQNVEDSKTELDSVKERVATLEENVTNINNRLDQIAQILESLTANVETLSNELSDVGRLSQFEQAPPPNDPDNPNYQQIYEQTDTFTNFNPAQYRTLNI